MSADKTALTAESFLKGAFDVLDAMTGGPFSFKVGEVAVADAAFLASTLPRYPVLLRARIKSGGAVGLLFSVADAARLAALINGSEETAASADEQAVLGVMREIAVPCLGAGVTNLMEKGGRAPEQPEGETAELVAPDKAGDLLAFFVKPPNAASFTYSVGALEGAGWVLAGPELERLLPDGPPTSQASAPVAPEPALSESEVSDILSGFDKTSSGAQPTAEAALASRAPSNLDMVLDIRLVATARLGRIEMPIGDILALGPGSIIDVGRLVDEPVELLVNNKLIARGDVVVVDEKFGLRITEIVSPKERIESMH